MGKMIGMALAVAGGCLALLLILGLRQYQLNGQFAAISSQSERAIFHFATIRESMTQALIRQNWPNLLQSVPEIEQLNAELIGIQENQLIPAEIKLALVDKVDAAGMVITLRALQNDGDRPALTAKLQEQLRSTMDQLLRYDRLIVSQVRERIVRFQMLMIGIMGLIISLASFSLVSVYRNAVVPLRLLIGQLECGDSLAQGLTCPATSCQEVQALTRAVANVLTEGRSAGLAREEDGDMALLAATINETANGLNGIINYAQLLADSRGADLAVHEQEILAKIIAGGTELAETWRKIT